MKRFFVCDGGGNLIYAGHFLEQVYVINRVYRQPILFGEMLKLQFIQCL